jgi:hypothetical protein
VKLYGKFFTLWVMEKEHIDDLLGLKEALILHSKALLTNASDDTMFTQELAALYCGISEYTLLKETNLLNIPGTKKGKFWYFVKKHLDAYMKG